MHADDEVVARAEVVALQKQIRELQRVLGKKNLESEILREAVKSAHEITHLAAAFVARGRYAVRRVAQVLGGSRSQLRQRLKEAVKSRSRYHKPENDDVLVELRASVDERPTYVIGVYKPCISPTVRISGLGVKQPLAAAL